MGALPAPLSAGTAPPRPADDIQHAVVAVVLVLQASSHHLVRVRRGHGEYFG